MNLIGDMSLDVIYLRLLMYLLGLNELKTHT